METKFQTSFIPKTTLEPGAGDHQKRPMGLVTFIATIIFFLSVLVAAGAFGWDKYLQSSEAQMKSDLDKNIKAFEPDTLQEYVRLNSRIDAAQQLLARHVAVSYIFDFLSQNTLQSVSFTDFKYDVGADGSAALVMNGAAKSYNAVAYQSEVFGKERSLEDPIFANLDLDGSGNVIFNFNAKVNPGFIVYTRKAAQAATDANAGDIVPIGAPTGQNTNATQPATGSTSGSPLPTIQVPPSTPTNQ